MQAPISPVVKKILADESKSKEFMSKLLQSGRETGDSIIEVDGKRYVIRRTASIPKP